MSAMTNTPPSVPLANGKQDELGFKSLNGPPQPDRSSATEVLEERNGDAAVDGDGADLDGDDVADDSSVSTFGTGENSHSRAGSVSSTKWDEILADVKARQGSSPCGRYWLDARHNHSFQVRGPAYQHNRAKIAAGAGICPLVWFDIFSVPDSYGTSISHIASKGACARRIESLTSGPNAPYLFVNAIQVPGSPLLYLVMYWGIDPTYLSLGIEQDDYSATASASHSRASSTASSVASATPAASATAAAATPKSTASAAYSSCSYTAEDRAFARLLQQYINIPLAGSEGSAGTSDVADVAVSSANNGITAASALSSPYQSPLSSPRQPTNTASSYLYNNSRYKLIPRIVDGPWLVRKAVGSVPCLLGSKVTTRYFRGRNYIETNVEVGSSSVAQRVIGCCRGHSGSIDVQLGIVLQGETSDELPERLLGAVQFKWLKVDDPAGQTPLFD